MNNKFRPATLVFEDVDPVFIKLAKRLQQLSKLNVNGLSVITLSLFLMDGEPLMWTRPDVNNLATMEPKGCSDEFVDRLKNMRK
jgi:hypothetical protein